MKLEGSLDGFGLPDLFALLGLTGKTGGLHLARQGCDGVVYFSAGQVTGATADSSRQSLTRRLICAGAVTDETLTAAVASASTGRQHGVVRALHDQGVIPADLLTRAVREQAVDAVFDLLLWAQGDFVFVVTEPNPDEVGVSLAAADVLAEAEARSPVWEQASVVITSPLVVPALPMVAPLDPRVSADEWQLLALVDGRRTVAELVELIGLGRFAVVTSTAGLVARGVLEVRGDAADGTEDIVAAIQRKHALLSPLEGQPFVPVRDRASALDREGQLDETIGESAGGHRRRLDAELDPVPELAPDRELVTAVRAEGGSAPLMNARYPAPLAAAAVDRPIDRYGFASAAAAAALNTVSPISRDPSVNRTLMLRLIAGVRAL